MKKTFKEYLQWEHSHNYSGTGDDMPDNFEKWLGQLDGGEYMEFAQDYGEYIKSEVSNTIMKEIQTWANESIGWRAAQSIDRALTEKFNK